MKPLLLTFLFVFVVKTTVFAQEEYPTDYKIEYELAFKIDSLNLELIDTEKMVLFAGPGFGVFVNGIRSDADERLEKLKQKYGFEVQVKVSAQSNKGQDLNKMIFTNYQNGVVKVLQEISEKDYVYIEPAKMDAWEIGEETKEFMGYTVQKATMAFAGRQYEAWFTIEVPISDGPYVFRGLPGLIVEIYDTQKHYHFKMLALEKLDVPKIWTLPNAEELSKDKINDIQKRLNNNALSGSDYAYMMGKVPGVSGSFSTFNGQIGDLDISDQSGQKITKEDLKKMFKSIIESRNNPIELE